MYNIGEKHLIQPTVGGSEAWESIEGEMIRSENYGREDVVAADNLSAVVDDHEN
jgi:hypothetical protein